MVANSPRRMLAYGLSCARHCPRCHNRHRDRRRDRESRSVGAGHLTSSSSGVGGWEKRRSMTGRADERLERNGDASRGGWPDSLRGDTATPIIEDARPVRGAVHFSDSRLTQGRDCDRTGRTISLKLGGVVGQERSGLDDCWDNAHSTRQREFRPGGIWPPAAVSSRAIWGYVTPDVAWVGEGVLCFVFVCNRRCACNQLGIQDKNDPPGDLQGNLYSLASRCRLE